MSTPQRSTPPRFFSFDGPKGVGKSTLIEAVTRLIAATNEVTSLEEKSLDPYREETRALLRQFRETPSYELELSICRALAKGRAWISQHVLPTAAGVVLIDRWVPSDAVFRTLVPFDQCAEINRAAGVCEPTVVFAVVCDAAESWRRAHGRDRGLDSRVVSTWEQHEMSIAQFHRTSETQGWHRVVNDRPVAEVAATVAQLILERVSKAPVVSMREMVQKHE